MYVDELKKICVPFPPKSGSTSLKKIINSSDLPFKVIETNYHQPLTFFAETFDLKGYTTLCFYRDPVDKFLSSFFHIKNRMHEDFKKFMRNKNSHYDDKMTIYEMMCMYDEISSHRGFELFFHPQYMWVNDSTILFNFHNYEFEINRMMRMLGAKTFEMFHENINNRLIESLDKNTLELANSICKKHYKEDFLLADRLNK